MILDDKENSARNSQHRISVSAARKIFNAGGAVAKPPRDHVDESFKAILQAWRRAPARARSRFVDDCKSELIELMGGGNAEA